MDVVQRARGAVDADVVMHLQHTLDHLSRADTAHLPPPVQARRADLLDVLDSYVAAGQFPRNHRNPAGRRAPVPVRGGMPSAPGRTPVFVDEHGTHCAVGYLLAASGRDDLVAAAVAQDVEGYLQELMTPELAAWAMASGFTAEELARIQPTYYWVHDARRRLDARNAEVAAQGCDQLWDHGEAVAKDFRTIQTGMTTVNRQLGDALEACVWEDADEISLHRVQLLTALVVRAVPRDVVRPERLEACVRLEQAWEASRGVIEASEFEYARIRCGALPKPPPRPKPQPPPGPSAPHRLSLEHAALWWGIAGLQGLVLGVGWLLWREFSDDAGPIGRDSGR